MEASVSEVEITIGLLVAFGGLGWLIYRVVATLPAGGPTSSGADTNALGGLPGSEQIDTHMADVKRGMNGK